MDPITATLLVLATLGVTAKATGGGVAHAAAAVRGKPSPAVQKWNAREKARQARGEKTRTRPGIVRTLADNAISEWAEKQAQKHKARLGAIREMGPETQAKTRDKMLRRAQRHAAVAGTAARWGNTSKEQLQRITDDVARVLAERRTDRAVQRGDADPDPTDEDRQQEATDAIGDQVTSENEDADVIPFRRPDQPHMQGKPANPPTTPDDGDGTAQDQDHQERAQDNTTENGDGTETADPDPEQRPTDNAQHNTTDSNGGPTMAEQTQTVEITDLDSAIKYFTVMREHLNTLANKLSDDSTTAASNADGLSQQTNKLDEAQGALTSQGFTAGTILQSVNEASDLVPDAAKRLEEFAQDLPNIAEQVKQVATAMSRAEKALTDQKQITEQMQSQSSNGIANNTRFYQEA